MRVKIVRIPQCIEYLYAGLTHGIDTKLEAGPAGSVSQEQPVFACLVTPHQQTIGNAFRPYQLL